MKKLTLDELRALPGTTELSQNEMTSFRGASGSCEDMCEEERQGCLSCGGRPHQCDNIYNICIQYNC